ncbi:hypothetical protein B0H12DRAFT_1137512 [Mycena haematopus]|nr:hypothetical protein B0H12DRAFT_1137512 [Mycena haematopus]
MGEFDTTLGALFVSYVLAWGLFGALSMQCATYFQRFPKDSLWLKYLVAALWIFDTLQLAVIGQGAYFWLITHYGDPAILGADSPRTIFLAVLVTNIIVYTVELFLARRVYILSNRNIFLTGFIVALSTVYFGLQLVTQVKTWQFKKLALLFKVQTVTSVSLAFAATADLTIAASLVVCLRRSRTGIKSTDSIVNTLVLYAMNTGLLTSIVVLVDMICFLTMPDNFIHLGIQIISGKLYTNSLLATLNFRDSVRQNGKFVNVNNTVSLTAMESSTGYKVGVFPYLIRIMMTLAFPLSVPNADQREHLWHSSGSNNSHTFHH